MCETQLQEILPEEPEVMDIPVQEKILPEAPPAPKKKKWIPYVILAGIFVVGLIFYLLTPGIGGPTRVTDSQLSWFSVENGTLYFDPAKYPGGSTLVVPETVAGQTVTALSENCFYGADAFIMVELPNTLKIIGDQAFAGCSNLRGVFIPESVTYIGVNAFMSCSSLESLCIPYSVTQIGTGAFRLCPKLVHIFYTGSIQNWPMLYADPITQYTFIYAADGTIRQADIAS